MEPSVIIFLNVQLDYKLRLSICRCNVFVIFFSDFVWTLEKYFWVKFKPQKVWITTHHPLKMSLSRSTVFLSSLSVCLSVCLFVCLSICLSVYLSVDIIIFFIRILCLAIAVTFVEKSMSVKIWVEKMTIESSPVISSFINAGDNSIIRWDFAIFLPTDILYNGCHVS